MEKFGYLVDIFSTFNKRIMNYIFKANVVMPGLQLSVVMKQELFELAKLCVFESFFFFLSSSAFITIG